MSRSNLTSIPAPPSSYSGKAYSSLVSCWVIQVHPSQTYKQKHFWRVYTLYKLAARPAIQTSTVTDPIDLSWTEKAKYVYVKVDEPQGLSPRFEGPYCIVSRPSRSTVTVRIGSYVNGAPRLQTYNWNCLKIAHLRDGAEEGSRPTLGRKPKQKSPSSSADGPEPTEAVESSPLMTSDAPNVNNQLRAKIQTSDQAKYETLSGNKPHPDYLVKGPIITGQMFEKWSPDMLGPSEPARPVRSTRNPCPKYVDSISVDESHTPRYWSATPDELASINKAIAG